MVTKFILDPIMRILKIVVTGTVLLLAACAETAKPVGVINDQGLGKRVNKSVYS